jgi:PAS domain-containing protein
MSFLRNDEGEIVEIVGVTRDISERKRAEQQEAELNAEIERAAVEWQRTVDALPSLIVILDHEGRVIRINKATIDSLGIGYADKIGNPVCEVGEGQPWRGMAERYRALEGDNTSSTGEITDETTGKRWNITATLSRGRNIGDLVIVTANEID